MERFAFFRVQITTSVILSRDLTHKLTADPDAVSLELVNQAAYRTPDPEIVGRAVAADGLAQEWKDHLRSRLSTGATPS
jgi:hypothetical protein